MRLWAVVTWRAVMVFLNKGVSQQQELRGDSLIVVPLWRVYVSVWLYTVSWLCQTKGSQCSWNAHNYCRIDCQQVQLLS